MSTIDSDNQSKWHSNEISRSVFDTLIEGCQIIDKDWTYLYVNDALTKQGKYSKEEFIGHSVMELYPGVEASPMFKTLQVTMKQRIPQRFEDSFDFPDGSSAWFEMSIQPLDEGILILSVDITQRKLGELSLLDKIDDMAALRKIDMAIAGSLDLNITMSIALEQVINRLQVAAATVLLLNSESGFLEYFDGKGFYGREISQSTIKLGEGLSKKAVFNHKLVTVHDLAGNKGFLRAKLLEKEKFVSYHCAPIIAKGEVIGVLELFERRQVEHKTAWFELFEMLAGQIAIGIDSQRLFHKLKVANRDLLLAYDATIEGWSSALDLRDRETEGHTLRVTNATVRLARRMGMSEQNLSEIRRGALLHDIGKLGVPDSILLKPTSLTAEEWVIMKQHPVYAYELLSKIDFLRLALDIPHYHHEKWDGSGYPSGLTGANIPYPARLFAIVDVWDALRSDRPYRKGWTFAQTMGYLKNNAGIHFDPSVVHEFLELMRDGDAQFRNPAESY